MTLSEYVMRYVRETLDACGGNKSEAARRLGIARRTLQRWTAGFEPSTGLPCPHKARRH